MTPNKITIEGQEFELEEVEDSPNMGIVFPSIYFKGKRYIGKAIPNKEKIKVVEVEVIRDGGTVIYEDSIGRRYFQWWATKKVYNQWPFPHGSCGRNNIPPEFVKELNVELEIVKNF